MESLDKGIRLFNEGRFFEAHEEGEKVWRDMEESPERYFIQGVIMIEQPLSIIKEANMPGRQSL